MNKDAFLIELCDVLDVPGPRPRRATRRAIRTSSRGTPSCARRRTTTIGKIDLYKEGAFIVEAKQGSDATSKKLGTAKRGTPAWAIAMNGAYGQALNYSRTLDRPVPFLVGCDIGHCFDLYAAFDGSWRLPGRSPTRRSRRVVGPGDSVAGAAVSGMSV